MEWYELLLKKLEAFKHLQAHKGHGVWHLAYTGTHLTYCGLVFLEGHSLYAFAAGGMLVLAIVGLLFYGEGG